MRQLISHYLSSLHLASPIGERVVVIPIRLAEPAAAVPDPLYDVLCDRTLDRVQVTEVSKEGVVGRLRVINRMPQRLFLLDGQELVGAKQNRILNVDVLVPAEAELIVPVSCVEQGRWSAVSPAFTPGKAASRRTRQRKAERVQASLHADRGYDAGQAQVWDEVGEVLALNSAPSATGALSDAYAVAEGKMAEHRRLLQPPEADSDTRGMAVLIGGRFAGLDLFDRPETLRHFWPSLIDSYLLELASPAGAVADATATQAGGTVELRAVLDAAACAPWESFRSPGEGTDLRVRHDRLVGSALTWNSSSTRSMDDGRVIHLQLFPRDEQQGTRPGAPTGYRPQIRRRRRGRPPADVE